ncbi:Succinyl-CoA--L-malate CoA-transferase beta subunit [bacterium HR23]|nr:Succinyl-CoA--L-malate CoA-transferase beta subunit [bacterium HR23]
MSALEGLLVVDLGRALAPRYASMLLGDMGARVVRIEQGEPPPAGLWHPLLARFFDRGKESALLDLHTPQGRDTLLGLLARAHVLLHDLPQPEAQALGLTGAVLAQRFPHLIVCRMPPFPWGWPQAHAPADDGVVSAWTGIYGDQGGVGNPPAFVYLPLPSYGAALNGVIAVTSALLARLRSGRGQEVEVSLVDGSLALQTGTIVGGPKVRPPAGGRRSPQGINPIYRLYEGSDGEWFFLACGNTTFWNKLCIALERPEWTADPRLADAPWGLPQDAYEPLTTTLAHIFRQKPRAYWLDLLRRHDIPCAPALTREEFLQHPQVAHNHILTTVEDPLLGTTRQMGVPLFLSHTPGRVKGPAPLPGQHTLQLLEEARRPPDLLPPPGPTPSAPLEGIRVVDLAMYIAGAYCSSILADLGADVVKVEPPTGDPFRPNSGAFQGWNRGKRGIVVDLTRPQGREVLYRLVERADVVVQNYRPGVAERLGADEASLRRINPRLVYCAVTGYGPHGPFIDRPAFDPLLQAQSGAMTAQGHPPVFLRVAITDYAAAMLGAWGVLLALWHRARTGQGQRVDSCLLNAAFAIQAGEFFQAPGLPRPHHLDQLGTGPGYRLFPAKDGWLFIACWEHAHWDALCRTLGVGSVPLPQPHSPEAERLSVLLEERFREREVAHWLSALARAGVPCAPARLTRDLFGEKVLWETGRLVEHTSADLGTVHQVGLTFHFSQTPGRLWRSAPALGQHTREVLAELGYTPQETDALYRARAVA